MKITQNTYPCYPNAAHGNIGETVYWELIRGAFRLVRDADKKTVFSTAPVNRDGLLLSTKKPPILIGMIAQVKSRNWYLEIR